MLEINAKYSLKCCSLMGIMGWRKSSKYKIRTGEMFLYLSLIS